MRGACTVRAACYNTLWVDLIAHVCPQPAMRDTRRVGPAIEGLLKDPPDNTKAFRRSCKLLPIKNSSSVNQRRSSGGHGARTLGLCQEPAHLRFLGQPSCTPEDSKGRHFEGFRGETSGPVLVQNPALGARRVRMWCRYSLCNTTPSPIPCCCMSELLP